MSENSKKSKIITIILITIFVIIGADFISYLGILYSQKKLLKENHYDYIKLPTYFHNRFVFHDHSTLDFFEKNPKAIPMRDPVGQEYKDKAIWLFGGSFAYGADQTKPCGVEDDKTFGYKLSRLTHRPLYNMSYQGCGIQHMLYQLKKQDTFAKLPEPEYIIFFHTSDYAMKLVKFTYDLWNNGAYLRYKLDKNGKLYEVKPFLEPLWNFYFVKVIFNVIEFKYLLNEKHFNQNFNILKAIFEESYRIIREHYPNAKFIILKYNEINGFDSSYFYTPRWAELEKEGFIIIDAEKLTGKNLKAKEYICDDNYHPSEKAFEDIASALSKKINANTF